MKILLIYPRPRNLFEAPYEASYTHATAIGWVAKLLPSTGGTSFTEPRTHLFFPPLSLLALVAVTPESDEVSIVDERFQPIPYDDASNFDLVGITVSTMAANHSYAIAKEFQKLGVPVVLGGIHPSIRPEEALASSDAIVVGEGELVWPKLLQDVHHGCLQRTPYKAGNLIDLGTYQCPQQRHWDLLDLKAYVSRNIIQTSRGCPHRCSFCVCSIDPIFGGKYRHRALEGVVEEIHSHGSKELFFIDDNFFGDFGYVETLLDTLIDSDRGWGAYATVSLGRKPHLIQKAAQAGCRLMMMGFETLDARNLTSYGKCQNLRGKYIETIRTVKASGILAFGCFIVGFDHDGYEVFDELLRFVDESGLDGVNVNVLQPYPATQVYQELEEAGRLLDAEWGSFDSKRGRPTFQLKRMDNDMFEQTFVKSLLEVYSLSRSFKRAIHARAPWLYRVLLLHYSLAKRGYYQKRLGETHGLLVT